MLYMLAVEVLLLSLGEVSVRGVYPNTCENDYSSLAEELEFRVVRVHAPVEEVEALDRRVLLKGVAGGALRAARRSSDGAIVGYTAAAGELQVARVRRGRGEVGLRAGRVRV